MGDSYAQASYAAPSVRILPPPYSPPAAPPSYSPAPAPYSPPVRISPPPPYSPPVRVAPPPYSPSSPVYASPVASYGTYGSSAFTKLQIPITRFSHEIKEGVSHQLAFETGHGISQSENLAVRLNPGAVGTFEDSNHGKAIVSKTGTVSYTSPEGQRINLQYTADENRFHPTGDHLPTSPPIPEAILESIRKNKEAEAARAAGGGGARLVDRYSYGSAPY